MLRGKLKFLVLALAGSACLLSVPRPSEAGLLRWLFGTSCCARRQAYRPVVVARPVMAVQPACAPTCCPTNPCTPQCTTTQRVCYNVPQTTYRTEYAQVPVTTYRPVTTYDPCTGCPRTSMQACNTTTLQARRVPVTTMRQVCSYRQVPVAPVVAAPVVTQFAPAPVVQQQYVAPSPGCSSCTAGHAAAAPIVQQQAAPGPLPQTQLGTQGGTTTADQLPILPSTPTPAYQNSYRRTEQAEVQPLRVEEHATTTPQRDAYVPRVQVPTIRPLPDLDRQERPSAPALLNPEDRTASRVVPAGAITPISWTKPAAQPAALTAPATKQWDDSGWSAAK